jgi:hypothetical protein
MEKEEEKKEAPAKKKIGRPKIYDVPYYERTKELFREKRLNAAKAYYLNNKQKVLDRLKRFYVEHREEITERRRLKYNGYISGEEL